MFPLTCSLPTGRFGPQMRPPPMAAGSAGGSAAVAGRVLATSALGVSFRESTADAGGSVCATGMTLRTAGSVTVTATGTAGRLDALGPTACPGGGALAAEEARRLASRSASASARAWPGRTSLLFFFRRGPARQGRHARRVSGYAGTGHWLLGSCAWRLEAGHVAGNSAGAQLPYTRPHAG